MGLEDAATLQWSTNCESMLPCLDQDNGGFHISPQFTSESAALSTYFPNDLPYSGNYNLTYSTPNPASSCPRSYASAHGLPGSMSNVPNSYPPSAYLIDPQKPQDVVDMSTQSRTSQFQQLQSPYENHVLPNIKVEESRDYDSRSYLPETDVQGRYPTPHDDPPLPLSDLGRSECNGTPAPDECAVDKEQPYAQLIYRALLEAPNHTMVLRDIYDWFKRNTDKAADKDMKGWQNSIRHNLSMNGAFEKVNHPSEEVKKGFMWRLTSDSLTTGVKSTTRYRKNQQNKRGQRSQHPQPQRQASGAKGGQAARRTAKFRRSQRLNDSYRSNPYSMSRSVPASAYSSGYDSNSDIPIAYTASPCYNSEVDFGEPTKKDDFGSPLARSSLSLLSSRSYSRSPHDVLIPDSAFVLPSDPSETLFYQESSTPSPPADDPLTPPSPGEWDVDTGPPTSTPFIYDDIHPNYSEFLG
ncbi:uncharacterized protein BDR25DRAFT_289340 [Lindgomyces ingoldianus]|uniref:Uncharacterized protein n=1 Tax=Lindgomyces ingoldianus TaxID=673940 RepID=A0ACB6QQE6_9PLEO|nr:uncharacterized protein BDR25DRAFT_289340 [Lindgomyces ingoldianus]KAF2469136.1 hypothetical protein BDR25DRAFT_289340 [Lindgomyces ingoldianus]